jgi:hypothetical protein
MYSGKVLYSEGPIVGHPIFGNICKPRHICVWILISDVWLANVPSLTGLHNKPAVQYLYD